MNSGTQNRTFRVFLGAPSVAHIMRANISSQDDPKHYSWSTVSSQTSWQSEFASIRASQRFVLLPSALEAASRRISSVYKHIIFDDEPGDELADTELEEEITTNPLEVTENDGFPSFLDSVVHGETTTHGILQLPRPESQPHTQSTLFASFNSYNVSDASSVAHFPTFTFNLNTLSSLASLSESSQGGNNQGGKNMAKVNLLLAVLEMEGPDSITTKNGRDQGKRVSVLKIILSDDKNNVCKLTAWREVAEAWGGSLASVPAAKRGDIVFLENISMTKESALPFLTASPFLKSKLEICYRTMPHAHEDMQFRPDLRLAASDSAVRKVATLVAWFEDMAGLKDLS